jgi:protoporphyrinogen oxidase
MKVIIGAGLAGIGAGLGLLAKHEKFVVLERQGKIGGLASSIAVGNWVFDHTGHFLHFKDSRFYALVSSIVELNAITREAAIAFRGRFVPYPFQQNLWALGPKEAIAMVMGAITARFRPVTVNTFEDWILASVGRRIAEAFMIPYNCKLYGVKLKGLSPKQGGSYIPRPKLREIVQGALIPAKASVGYNAIFYYPKAGAIQAVAEALARPIKDRILLEHEVVSIDVTRREVRCRSGEVFRYDPPLFSTIPLPVLATIIEAKDGLTGFLLEKIQCLARSLKATRILSINIGLKGQVNLPYHWIYVPEEHYPFYRIGIYSNVTPSSCPDGCSSIWAEINLGTEAGGSTSQVDAELLNKTLDGILRLGLILPDTCIDVIYFEEIWPAYVLFQLDDNDKIAKVREFLRRMGVMSIGRYGKWAYMSMEESFKDGLEAVGCSIDDILGLFEPLGEG